MFGSLIKCNRFLRKVWNAHKKADNGAGLIISQKRPSTEKAHKKQEAFATYQRFRRVLKRLGGYAVRASVLPCTRSNNINKTRLKIFKPCFIVLY